MKYFLVKGSREDSAWTGDVIIVDDPVKLYDHLEQRIATFASYIFPNFEEIKCFLTGRGLQLIEITEEEFILIQIKERLK